MADVANPYVAGSPLSSSEMFFGRADVFDFVKQTLAREGGVHAIALYGQRRTGKTSVLNQLPQQLGTRYLCVFIDLQMLDLNGLDAILWQLAMHIRRRLDREHQISLPPLDRVAFMAEARDAFRTQFLDQVWAAIGDHQLVLLVDEVVRLQEAISAGHLERDIFDYLRHLMQHYPRLQFVFALGTSLAEMERDYAFLFSVGLYRKISFLERTVAEALITDPVRDSYTLEPAAVAQIYHATSGHPFYTQLLCQTLFNHWQTKQRPRLTEADVLGVLPEVTELGSPALKNVWDDSTLGERVVAAGLAAAIGSEGRAIQAGDLTRFWAERGLTISRDERALAFQSLTARDVLVGEEDRPSFSVELQRRWIEQYGRPEWVRQQVAAAQSAEAATDGPRPATDGFRLFEPAPPPPDLPPPPLPPAPTGAWGYLDARFNLSPIRLLGGGLTGVFAAAVIVTVLLNQGGSPSPPTETPTVGPAQVGGPSSGTAETPGSRTGAQAGSSGSIPPTATPGAPASTGAGASTAPPAARLPTPTPPPVMSGDALHTEILQAADRAGIPRTALLALAEAETGRRSNAVEPTSVDEAIKAWPAVYAGWARQRVSLTDFAQILPPPGEGPPSLELLERVINACLKAGPAGDRAAAMLRKHLSGPSATRDQILKALVAYRAENTGEDPAAVEARDAARFQAALAWAEQALVPAVASSPSATEMTPVVANASVTTTGVMTPVTANASVTAPRTPTPTMASVQVRTPDPRFNPNAPTVLQTADWNDTPAVTTWMLQSLGRPVTLREVTDEMVSKRIASSDLGLLDGSGAAWAGMIGATWDEKAFNKRPIAFDDVAAMAGRIPIAIGGRNWYHWTAVRGVNADGDLLLANPAGSGPRFGQQRLNREQFEVLGPFAAVWIEP